MSEKAAIWRKRVANWRASGESAVAYSAGRGWSAHSLRWWASRLGREAEPTRSPSVSFAHLVRATVPERAPTTAVVVEWLEARVRVTVEAGADHELVCMVLEQLARECSEASLTPGA
jgi:hypothetical protein